MASTLIGHRLHEQFLEFERANPHKKSSPVWGGHYVLPSGKKLYLGYRFIDDFYRDGEGSIDAAASKGVLKVAIDTKLLQRLQLEDYAAAGILLIGGSSRASIRAQKNGSLFMAPLDDWFKVAEFKDFSYIRGKKRYGAAQHFMPVSHMTYRPGRIVITP